MQLPIKPSAGFTLVQLLCVIAIIGIMVQVGSGLFAGVVHSKALRTTATQLQKRIEFVIRFARSNGSAVALCAGQSTSCNAGSWDDGYVTVSTNMSGDTPSTVNVIHRNENVHDAVSIKANMNKAVFLPGGFVDGIIEPKFTVCSPHRINDVYEIIVELSGIVRLEQKNGKNTCST